jgi:hypothetical protein
MICTPLSLSLIYHFPNPILNCLVCRRESLKHLQVIGSNLQTIILHLDLYGCETWSLTSREETETEGVREKGVEESIWSEYGQRDGRVEKT